MNGLDWIWSGLTAHARRNLMEGGKGSTVDRISGWGFGGVIIRAGWVSDCKQYRLSFYFIYCVLPLLTHNLYRYWEYNEREFFIYLCFKCCTFLTA